MIKNTFNHLDYLIIGHITRDIHEGGYTIGGTAAYAAFCARALGRRPAILTSGAKGQTPWELDGFQIKWINSKNTTTFENIETEHGRKQVLHAIADPILPEDVPQDWRNSSIVHLGPIANEVDPGMINIFPNSFIGLTPQGWMRARDENNIVHFHEWEHADNLLKRANAVVLSIEDVKGDEEIIQSYANKTNILTVTEGCSGARVYWKRDVRHFSAPNVSVLDPIGAGDIFATAFFDKLEKTSDPWESAKIAVKIASRSVTREGLAGIPTAQEISSFQVEIIEGK